MSRPRAAPAGVALQAHKSERMDDEGDDVAKGAVVEPRLSRRVGEQVTRSRCGSFATSELRCWHRCGQSTSLLRRVFGPLTRFAVLCAFGPFILFSRGLLFPRGCLPPDAVSSSVAANPPDRAHPRSTLAFVFMFSPKSLERRLMSFPRSSEIREMSTPSSLGDGIRPRHAAESCLLRTRRIGRRRGRSACPRDRGGSQEAPRSPLRSFCWSLRVARRTFLWMMRGASRRTRAACRDWTGPRTLVGPL